jgi:hypothetical protein
VPVTTAIVLSGVFTVHAKHPLDFCSGFHQFSSFAIKERRLTLEEAAGLPRLGDGVHQLEFVGKGVQYA